MSDEMSEGVRTASPDAAANAIANTANAASTARKRTR